MKEHSGLVNWKLLMISFLAGLAAYVILLAIGSIFDFDYHNTIYYLVIAVIIALVIFTFKLEETEKRIFRHNYEAGISKKQDRQLINYYCTYNEKKTPYFHIPFGLFVLALGIYFLLQKEVAGIIMLMVGGGFLYIAMQPKKTYIKLSKDGIWTRDFGFLYFKDLERIEFHRFYASTHSPYMKIYVKNNALYKMKKPFLLQAISTEIRKELPGILTSKTSIPVTKYGI